MHSAFGVLLEGIQEKVIQKQKQRKYIYIEEKVIQKQKQRIYIYISFSLKSDGLSALHHDDIKTYVIPIYIIRPQV